MSFDIADQCETLDQARGVIRALLLSETLAPSISVESTHVGISLRDLFAGLAMQGLMSSWGQHDVTDFGEIAHDAYGLADCMLAQREKA